MKKNMEEGYKLGQWMTRNLMDSQINGDIKPVSPKETVFN
jgi:hypothetical protein